MNIFDKVKVLIETYSESLKMFTLCIVCNTKSAQAIPSNRDTEYFSDDEFEEIISMFTMLGMNMEFFLNENDFIQFVLNDKSERRLVVYNAAQSGKGPGRKSLLPSFCNLHKILIAGSNAYVVSLCRHKYHTNKLLSAASFPVPRSWIYANRLLDLDKPDKGQKIILKPLYESASIGVDSDSVVHFSDDDQMQKMLRKRQTMMEQPIMLQQFIEGYEVEVPILSYSGSIVCLPPIGISLGATPLMNNQILDYETVYFDKYRFYDFRSIGVVSDLISKTAEEIALYLGIEGLGRVDFRVKRDFSFFVTDVSTNPHFIEHSSTYHAFRLLGMNRDDIAKVVICEALSKIESPLSL